ncbi:PQQ-binding-like beta-propeller repeat protein [Pirellulaceae bacterium SH449]
MNKQLCRSLSVLTRHRSLKSFAIALAVSLISVAGIIVSQNAWADWPFVRGNISGTGVADKAIPENPSVIWEFKTEKPDEGFEATPVIFNGLVIIGDFKGTLYAIELATGKLAWKHKLKQGVVVPAACGSDRIIVGDFDSNIYCLDLAGKEVWSRETEQPMANGALILGNDVLYASDYGAMVCLDLESGKEKWVYETGDQLKSSPAVWKNLSFLGGCDSQLHKVNLSSGESEGTPIPLMAPTLCTPNVVGDTVIIPTQPGTVYAVRVATGEQVWSYTPDSSLGLDVRSSPATLAEPDGESLKGTVVVPSRNRRLIALDAANGQLKWESVLRKRSDSSPVISGERVWLGASDGKVSSLDLATGNEVWSYQLTGQILASPAASEGKLVIATEKGLVVCFGGKP